jgi:hypothetical protein
MREEQTHKGFGKPLFLLLRFFSSSEVGCTYSVESCLGFKEPLHQTNATPENKPQKHCKGKVRPSIYAASSFHKYRQREIRALVSVGTEEKRRLNLVVAHVEVNEKELSLVNTE